MRHGLCVPRPSWLCLKKTLCENELLCMSHAKDSGEVNLSVPLRVRGTAARPWAAAMAACASSASSSSARFPGLTTKTVRAKACAQMHSSCYMQRSVT